jgi:hypothetical protein
VSNALYTKGKQKLLEGSIDLADDDIRVALVDTGVYTANLSTDDFYSDIPNNAVVAIANLENRSVTDGVFDADDATFLSVPASSNTIELIVILKWTGNSETSPILGHVDTANGLPTTPNDGNITIIWSEATSKIFRLV